MTFREGKVSCTAFNSFSFKFTLHWNKPYDTLVSNPIAKQCTCSSVQTRPSLFAGSSDDSYLSADEEPDEGPVFEKPIENTTAPSGSEVKLQCIITGSPAPTGMTENFLFID